MVSVSHLMSSSSMRNSLSLTISTDLPDLTNEKTTEMLDRWDGNWSFLTNLSWVKIQASGRSAPASFPPQTN